jgi:hypothetical protein
LEVAPRFILYLCRPGFTFDDLKDEAFASMCPIVKCSGDFMLTNLTLYLISLTGIILIFVLSEIAKCDTFQKWIQSHFTEQRQIGLVRLCLEALLHTNRLSRSIHGEI